MPEVEVTGEEGWCQFKESRCYPGELKCCRFCNITNPNKSNEEFKLRENNFLNGIDETHLIRQKAHEQVKDLDEILKKNNLILDFYSADSSEKIIEILNKANIDIVY